MIPEAESHNRKEKTGGTEKLYVEQCASGKMSDYIKPLRKFIPVMRLHPPVDCLSSILIHVLLDRKFLDVLGGFLVALQHYTNTKRIFFYKFSGIKSTAGF